jgi:hypothetical protein
MCMQKSKRDVFAYRKRHLPRPSISTIFPETRTVRNPWRSLSREIVENTLRLVFSSLVVFFGVVFRLRFLKPEALVATTTLIHVCPSMQTCRASFRV